MKNVTCAWIGRDEIFEDYVRDALRPEDRDAFEAHYFACAACAGRLETYQALQAELAALPAEASAEAPARAQARGWPWRRALVPLGASLVLLAVAALWVRPPAPTAPESTVAVAPARPPAVAAPPAEPSMPEQKPAAAKDQPARPAAPLVVALSVLARVEPPLYVPLALRGGRDEAAEAFDAAMRLYAAGDYAGAIPGLRAAADLNPEAPRTLFFLAACLLLTGDTGGAAEGFERAIALGDSPYLEDARFYLAKARLRQGRVTAAREELRQVASLRGRLEQDARRLLGQLDALAAGKDRPPDP
jgi:tetratricopeptide (TPR) repeat protein